MISIIFKSLVIMYLAIGFVRTSISMYELWRTKEGKEIREQLPKTGPIFFLLSFVFSTVLWLPSLIISHFVLRALKEKE